MRKPITLLLVAGVLGGCGSQSLQTQSQPPAPATAVNPTDAAWLGLMIPMDEQFLRVLALAPSRTTDPAVRRLAEELTVSHQAELEQLVALRDQAGLPTANQHEGHDMPGMMTEKEITALGRLRGPAFDRVLRSEVKDHLAQSLVVTRGVKSAGHDPGVIRVATTIETLRTTQLSRWPPATPRTAG